MTGPSTIIFGSSAMCGPTAITLSGPRSTGTLLSVLVSETAAAPSLLGVRVGGTLGAEVALFWRVLGASGEFGVGGVVGEEFHSLGKPRELDVVVRWLVVDYPRELMKVVKVTVP